MPAVYYIGGPADLTKQTIAERLYSGDIRLVPIMQKLSGRPISGDDPIDIEKMSERLTFKTASYLLQQVANHTFIALHQGDDD